MRTKKRFNEGSELANKEFSDGSGLEFYELTFRMYDAQIGRFLQQDPLGEAMEERSGYSYANNNPIGLNDALGLTSDSTHPQKLEELIVVGHKTEPKHQMQPDVAGLYHCLQIPA